MPKCLMLAALLCCCASQVHADWPRWRGPQDSGSLAGGNYPNKLDETTLAWKAPLPGKGCSTPIISAGQIYLTAPINGQDALLAFDKSGKPKWNAIFGEEVQGKHRNGSGSNASPVTDGGAVFVYFKSGTLAAVERDGAIRWQTNLVDRYGPVKMFWDHGTSPVLTKKHVIMVRMHAGESWLAAFDRESGELAWKVARNYQVKTENDQCYTTPLVRQHNGREVLLVWGAEHLTMHDSADGRVVWSCTNFNSQAAAMWPAIATPVIVNDMAVIAFGRNDKGSPRLFGVRLDGKDNVTDTNHVWKRTDISSFVPTPIAYEGRVYLVRDKGEVECIDPRTGKSVWSDAFPRNRKSFYASPLIAGDKLYAPREDGVVFVASVADGKFQLLSENDMEEPVIGSPVPMGRNQLLIRGEDHLYCLAGSVDATN